MKNNEVIHHSKDMHEMVTSCFVTERKRVKLCCIRVNTSNSLVSFCVALVQRFKEVFIKLASNLLLFLHCALHQDAKAFISWWFAILQGAEMKELEPHRSKNAEVWALHWQIWWIALLPLAQSRFTVYETGIPRREEGKANQAQNGFLHAATAILCLLKDQR